MQYFFARDPGYDVTKFEPAQFADRLREISALMDSTNPDLSAFSAHGGKLIMYENMADYAQRYSKCPRRRLFSEWSLRMHSEAPYRHLQVLKKMLEWCVRYSLYKLPTPPVMLVKVTKL